MRLPNHSLTDDILNSVTLGPHLLPGSHVAEARFSAAAAVCLPPNVRDADNNLGNESMLIAKRSQLQVE